MKARFSFEKIFLFSVFFIGGAVAFYQFLYNRSLWLDEASLALNIIRRTPKQLLQPLDLIQVAPILFLQIEKVFSFLFQNTEYGLRIFPLICYYTSIYFFYNILNLLFKNIYVIIISLSFFVLNSTLVYYSSEVKQYMADVCCFNVVFFLALTIHSGETKKYLQLLIMGIVFIFLSNVAPIILGSAGLYIFTRIRNDHGRLKLFAGITSIWLLFFAAYFLLFIHDHPSKDEQIANFTALNGFMPINPLRIEFYQFLLNQYLMIFSNLTPYGIIGFFAIPLIILLAIYKLLQNSKNGLILVFICPVIIHLFLSSLKLYPFISRLAIYLVPGIILLFSIGLESTFIGNHSKFGKTISRFITAAVVFFLFSILIRTIPFERSELKKTLKTIMPEIQPGDKIYVNFFAAYSYRYYQESQAFMLPLHTTILGNRYDTYESEAYLEEIRSLDGRVWFIYSTYIAEDQTQMNIMLKYFETKGIKGYKEFSHKGSSALLFILPENHEIVP